MKLLQILLLGILSFSCQKQATSQANFTFKNGSIDWVPYLKKDGSYIYVDKEGNHKIDQTFVFAEPFLSSGHALVLNDIGNQGVIDSLGNLVDPFSEHSKYLWQVSGVTLLFKYREFEKKLPFYKWDFNILSSSIKKTATYMQVNLEVIETGQVLVDTSYDYLNSSSSPVDIEVIDTKDILVDGSLYTFKNGRFSKVKKSIESALSNDKYIVSKGKEFAFYDASLDKEVITNLVPQETISFEYEGNTIVLDSLHKERFASLPKVLQDKKTKQTYICPKYDKPLPQIIQSATKEQLDFLTQSQLVLSISDTPYFLVGRFNYNHDIWAYDFIYLDQKGNLLDSIEPNSFYVVDQIGRLIWPTKFDLLSSQELEEPGSIGTIYRVGEGSPLYIVSKKENDQEYLRGIWNTKTKTWEVLPSYWEIEILDSENEIFGLQKGKEDPFFLYDNSSKYMEQNTGYSRMQSSGLVVPVQESNRPYYMDFKTNTTYKE
ncbi:hypothetical protein ACYSNM_10690 [Myroides sp. LJL116]